MKNISLRRGQSPTATVLDLNGMRLVFSYETVVAFFVPGEGWTVSENVWGNTTGKHMNQETGVAKADRMPRAEYLLALDALLAKI